MTIKLVGSSSGSVSLQAPASTTGGANRTLTLPDINSTVDTIGRAGNILQVKHAQKTDSFSTSSASWNNVPSLQANITTTNASNQVLVQVNISGLNGTTTGSGAAVQRTTSGSSSFIGLATGYGNRQNISGAELYNDRDDVFMTSSFTILDTPGAGTHTYTVMVDPNGQTLYVNKSETDGDNGTYSRGTSDITLWEIAV